MSLDMHRTTFHGLHWTFGVTYIQMNVNIEQLIKSVKDNNWAKVYFKYVLDSETPDPNIDCFFTYLKDKNKLNVQTFNIENLYFAHWGICTVYELFKLLQVAKNGLLYFPIAGAVDDNRSHIKIPNDIINFDCGVDLQSSTNFMKRFLFMYANKLDKQFERFQLPEIREKYENLK